MCSLAGRVTQYNDDSRVETRLPRLVHDDHSAHLEYSEQQQLKDRHPYEVSEEHLRQARRGDGRVERLLLLRTMLTTEASMYAGV